MTARFAEKARADGKAEAIRWLEWGQSYQSVTPGFSFVLFATVIVAAWPYRRQTAPVQRNGRCPRFNSNAFVDGSADPLFTAKISLSRLDRNVSEKELDLFQLRVLSAFVRRSAPGNPSRCRQSRCRSLFE
jgi:hypothetical protein